MLTETYFSSREEALEAVMRMKADKRSSEYIVNVENSYGMYRINLTPIDFAMDMIELNLSSSLSHKVKCQN